MVSLEFEAGRRLGFVEKELEKIAKELEGKKDLEDESLFKKATSAYGEYLTIAAEQGVAIFDVEDVSDTYRRILQRFKIERPSDNLPF